MRKLFLMTLCTAYTDSIVEKVIGNNKAYEKRKYIKKANRTNATTQDLLIGLFIRKHYKRGSL